ncbi:hypothetical protein CHUAL_005191 [Chamberlinius hualienensis]
MAKMELKHRQIISFAVAWVAFGSTYLLRKPIGVIKTDLQSAFHFDEARLGWFDTALLFPYASLQILISPVADQLGVRITLTICLIISSLSMIGFGAVTDFHVFFILLFICGAAQSLTWPCAVKAVGSWYPGHMRNAVMGVFGTSPYAGGIIGAASAVFFQHNYGWKSVFVIPSIVIFVIAIVVYFVLRSPEEMNIIVTEKHDDEIAGSRGKYISFVDLLRIPAVLAVALSVLCLKTVRYCMFMWLPMYLYEKNKFSKPEAGLFSTLFEVGGMIGSVTIGFVIDKYFKKNTLLGTAVSAFLSAITLAFFFMANSSGTLFSALFLMLSGALSCGPDVMLGSSIAMELGEMNSLNAGFSVIGLINGLGSIGTFLEGPLFGYIISIWDWDGMAVSVIVLSLLGSLCCWKAALIHQRQISISH